MGIRALTAADEPELERFALMAAFAPHSPLPEGAEAMAIVRRWLEGWSELDPGVCWEQQGELGAAAWARSVEPVIARFAAGEPLLEVVLAVDARLRGQGIGRAPAPGVPQMKGTQVLFAGSHLASQSHIAVQRRQKA